MKNILDKHYFDRLRGGILSDDDVQLLLEVIGPMLIETDYVIVKREELKKHKDLELGLSPTVSHQNDDHKCIIEFEGYAYEFEFPQAVRHVAVRKIK